MLRAIVQHSTKFVAFLNALKLALSQPQIRHLTEIVDASALSNPIGAHLRLH
jgi:hypothetical protein